MFLCTDKPASPQLTRGRVSSTSIELKWLLGANGGAPVTSFRVRYAAHTAWREFALPDALARSFVLTRLNCSTQYTVQLVAVNDAGASEPAELSETTVGSRMPRSISTGTCQHTCM